MAHILLLYRIRSSNHEPISANKNLVEKNKRWISQKDESKDIVKKMINIKVSFTLYAKILVRRYNFEGESFQIVPTYERSEVGLSN